MSASATRDTGFIWLSEWTLVLGCQAPVVGYLLQTLFLTGYRAMVTGER